MDAVRGPEVRAGKARKKEGSSTHWLVRVAKKADFSSGDSPDISASRPISEAWSMAARAFGVTTDDLVRAVADYYHLKVADAENASKSSARLLPEPFARKHCIVPIDESERHIYVATADPTNVEAERVIGFTSGRSVQFQIASPDTIENLLEEWYSGQGDGEGDTYLQEIDVGGIDEDAVTLVEEMEQEEITERDAEAAPVIKLTNLIIHGAISEGASDIHLEPSRSMGLVRYRVDGVLHKAMDLPMRAMHRVVSRIKILADLDIADRLRPQDGKARVRVGDGVYDLRVSTIPATGRMEKCVIRILDTTGAPNLDELGLPSYEMERLRKLLSYRDGVVIVTGPTGSGKTTTLYAALQELSDGKINIMTVEDPVEYELPSITQTQVATKQGVTFATALRAMLRQDPDVILVGEIRDEETAQVAFRAAMTGHLVLATVHANDAVGAIARLSDLGLEAGALGSTLRGALAQRLLRRVCPKCSSFVGDDLSDEEQRLSERHHVEPTVRAVGCIECAYSGFRGRIPVQEVLIVDSTFQGAVETQKGSASLSAAAIRGGMRTMHEVARHWVKQGKTTLSEVERVLGQLIESEDEEEDQEPRILVVDDDESARVMMQSLLEENDFQVELAEDGEEALEMLEDDARYAMVILDLYMPGIDGQEVLEELRSRSHTKFLPVLVRTGAEGHEVETKLLEAGADDYITKSVDAPRFLARVKAVLRRAAV